MLFWCTMGRTLQYLRSFSPLRRLCYCSATSVADCNALRVCVLDMANRTDAAVATPSYREQSMRPSVHKSSSPSFVLRFGGMTLAACSMPCEEHVQGRHSFRDVHFTLALVLLVAATASCCYLYEIAISADAVSDRDDFSPTWF